VLFLLFVVLRRLVNRRSACRLVGIREGGRRMPAIGVDVNRRLRAVFTVGAAVAGVAGALLAQTTQFVGLDVAGFSAFGRTADHAGAGRHRAAVRRPGRRRRLHAGAGHISGLNPAYWQFYIGLLLVLIVLFARGGILGGLERWSTPKPSSRKEQRMTQTSHCAPKALSKRWGAFKRPTATSASRSNRARAMR
jgi:branched-chain amino acid transport system permease protein